MARILDLLILAGTAMLAVRLVMEGLYRRYRMFFLYLLCTTLQLGVLASVTQDGRIYQEVWVLTEPLEWLLFILVILEIYTLVLQDYKGLATAGRWVLISAIVIAFLASALSLAAPSQLTSQGPLMRYYFVAERAVNFSLAAFLVSILAFLLQYPVVLNRNTIVHSLVFFIYFLGNTVLYLLLTVNGSGSLPVFTYTFDAITLVAIGAWLFMLTPAGEQRKQQLRPKWMPGQEEHLVAQLNNLNAALLRATGNRPK